MFKFLLKSAVRSAIRAADNSYNTPERIGARGERKVHNTLTSVLDASEYRVLSDLILPISGGTTQLDHLVLSRYGIFVIETKNFSGWIFGDADQKRWTQVQKGGKKRRFQNPLHQNYAHVKAVEGILGIDRKYLHSFVVFTGSAEPKTPMPENVAWGLQALGRLIGVRKQTVISDDQVNAYIHKLQNQALDNTRAARKDHVRHLEAKAAARAQPQTPKPAKTADSVACPKCGGKMVKRTGKKTGTAFWGCADFPKCWGRRKIV
ncbi:MAG: NERD domain-containing protein [Rhodobacteraceae bacterium]|nr:NERD domain-containing protein [Paracoccaceae bacterium]